MNSSKKGIILTDVADLAKEQAGSRVGTSVAIASGLLTGLFFVFPQLPVRVRLVGLLFLCAGPFALGLRKSISFKLSVVFFGSMLCAGMATMVITGSGDAFGVLYPVRSLFISVFVLIFMRSGNLKLSSAFIAVWMILQLGGLLVDIKRGPVEAHIPFAIFSELEEALREARTMTHERSGGFTFEAGVLGGMTAFFMILATMRLAGLLFQGSVFTKWLESACLGAALVAGCTILALTKTKAGIAVLALFWAISMIGVIVSTRAKMQHKITVLCGAAALGVGVFIVLVPLSESTGLRSYIDEEVIKLRQIVDYGMGVNESAGIGTRTEMAKAATYGLMKYPLGVGVVNGHLIYEKVGDRIENTTEMDFLFSMGAYNGFKGYLFNTIVRSGIIGLLTLMGISVLAVLLMGRYTSLGYMIAIGFFPSIILLAASVEMLPLWEMLVFAYGYGLQMALADAPFLAASRDKSVPLSGSVVKRTALA
jgi:hypothetical protein